MSTPGLNANAPKKHMDRTSNIPCGSVYFNTVNNENSCNKPLMVTPSKYPCKIIYQKEIKPKLKIPISAGNRTKKLWVKISSQPTEL